MLKNYKLNWSLIPATSFLHLKKFKRSESKYGPFLGKGIYCLIYPSKVNDRIYYVGKSNEIGMRLWSHCHTYTNPKNGLWLPNTIDYFDEDIYKYYKYTGDEMKKYFSQGYGATITERGILGKKILENSYFAFANLYEESNIDLLNIESIIQFSILKCNNLPSLNWLGETVKYLSPEEINIKNIYSNGALSKVIGVSLPKEISLKKSELSFK